MERTTFELCNTYFWYAIHRWYMYMMYCTVRHNKKILIVQWSERCQRPLVISVRTFSTSIGYFYQLSPVDNFECHKKRSLIRRTEQRIFNVRMGPCVLCGPGLRKAGSICTVARRFSAGAFPPHLEEGRRWSFLHSPFLSILSSSRVQCDHQRWVLLGTTFPTSCRSTKCNQRRRFSANLRTCTVQIRIFKCCVELRVSVNRNQFLSQLDHHFKQYEYSKKHRENDLAHGFVVGREGR